MVNFMVCVFCVCMNAKLLQLCMTVVTLWTIACQASLSMGFSRQEYWSGLPCPPPGDLHDPEIKPTSVMSPALVGEFFTTSSTIGQTFFPSELSFPYLVLLAQDI